MNGLWDAYRGIRRQHETQKMKNQKNISKPDKPYIMDINAFRQTLFTEQKSRGTKNKLIESPSRLAIRQKSLGSNNSDVKLVKLKEIVRKCDQLFYDNKDFKTSTVLNIIGLDKAYQNLEGAMQGKKKVTRKRLSELELRQIKRDLIGLSTRGSL